MTKSLLFGAILLLVGLVLSPPMVEAKPLVIGTVAKDIKEELAEFEPLAIYLEGQLAASGVESVEVAVLPTAAEMSKAFQNGDVDLYIESPLVAARVGSESGAIPLVRRSKKGVGEYWSEIIVPASSGVKTLADLKGKVLAFEDPDSTSGHYLPRALLLQEKLSIQELKHATETPDDGHVGAVFTLGDKTSILWLLSGRVDAVATDPSFVAQIEKERPGAVRSIARSISVPRHVVMRAGDMPAAKSQQIASVLIAMADSEEGRKVLAAFDKTDRFDAFPAGVEATFAPIHEQLRLLDTEQPHTETQ